MEQKILNLYLQGLNSLQISKLLIYSKEQIEIILLKNYFYNVRKHKSNDDEILNALQAFHKDSTLTLKELCKNCNCTSVQLGHIFKQAGIYLYHKSSHVGHLINWEIVNEMANEFKNGKTKKEISERYNISVQVISRLFKKYHIDFSEIQINSTFFHTIDTEQKAYLLGFLYADGNVSEHSDHVSCDLKWSDIQHLELFYQLLNVKRNPRLDPKLKRCRFAVHNKQIKLDLIKYGCIPNKSLSLTFPHIEWFQSTELIRHFIRGYFDGDGCISYISTRKQIFRPRCSIVGTKSMLERIEQYSQTKWTWHIANSNNNKIFDMKSTINESIKFLDWIYSDAKIYLYRKYQRYLCFKQNNFAVSESDFRNNDWAISVKAKQYLYDKYQIDIAC